MNPWTKKQREEIQGIEQSVNSPKSELIRIEARMRAVDPKRADKLWTLIGKLEAWQAS